MRLLSVLSFLFLIFALRAYAVPPVLNYAGQVTVNGEAFDGNGQFKFALVNVAGTTTYWSNDGTSLDGSEPQGSIQVPVNGGLYSILLGNTAIQGMSALDPSIFQQYSDAKLRVWFSDGVNGFQKLTPDRSFASVPYALTAGDVSDSSISLNSLSQEVLNALKVTPSISTQPFARYDWRTDSATIEARGRGLNISYQWLKNGVAIAGANAPVLGISNPDLDDISTYSVRITNSVGQTTSQTLTLQQAIGAPGFPLAEANATQVPRNGLVLWLDANDLNADGNEDALVVGDRVESWTDKISKNKAEQDDLNKQPTKGISGMVFSLNHSLVIGDLNTSAKHILIVGKRKYRQGWSSLIKGKGINQVRWYHSMSDISEGGGTTEFTWGTGGSRRISGGFTSLPLDETFIVTLTKGNHSLDGGLFADLTIGSGLDGEISEILFYDRFLQNNERDAVERYLSDKWNIQLHADKLGAEQAAYDAAIPVNEPEEGLQAYYKFEPVSVEPNKLWDHSGNDNHLSMSGFDGDPWVEGIEGHALLFVNGNAKAIGGQNVDYGSITFWAKANHQIGKSSHSSVVFSAKQNGSNFYFFEFNKKVESTFRNFNLRHNNTHSASHDLLDHNSFTLNAWFHFSLVFSSNRSGYSFFLNGNEIDTEINGSSRLIFPEQFALGVDLGFTNSPHFEGILDEFRIYNRSLTPAEVEGLYLQVDSPILRMAPEHNATVGTNFSLNLAADNGPTTYFAEGLPAGLSLNVSTGQITGTVSQPGYHRVFVKAMNEHGTGSDTIAIVARPQTDQYGWPVDVPDGSDIPQNGLVLWLDANDVDADGEFDSGTDHLKLANWADKASKDHNATQATAFRQPTIRAEQLPERPGLNLLRFDGNQSLAFPTLNNGRTFFWVVNRGAGNSVNAAFMALEGTNYTANWGINSHNAPFRYAFKYVNDGLQRRNGENRWLGSTSSFLTDLQVLTLRTTDFQPADLIGKEGNDDFYFTGNIGEILVYDRALSISEIETVEKYLGQKWGIALEGAGAPLDITSGLMAHIPFDENSGNVASDVSGNNRHATLVNFDTNNSWIQGKIGGAIDLDGANDFVTIPLAYPDKFTIALWLKTKSTTSTWNGFYSFSTGILAGAHSSLSWSLSNGKITYFFKKHGNLGASKSSNNVVNHGNWVHLALAMNSNSHSLFIDGNLDFQHFGSTDISLASSSSINLGRLFDSNKYLPATFDDFRMYDRVLLSSEIQAIKNLGFNPVASSTYLSPNPSFVLTPATNSVSTTHLTEQILKYLKPEITTQPQGTMVPANGSATLTASAEGKFLSYQWQKDGTDLIGETNATLVFSDFNGTQDDGNYTITISNDFGSVISAPAEVKEQ